MAKTTKEDLPLSPHSAEKHATIDLVFQSRRGGFGVRHKDSCSICLEPFRVGDRIARVKQKGEDDNDDHEQACGNWFKEDCIVEWLKRND